MKKLIFPLVTAGLLTAALAVPAFAGAPLGTPPIDVDELLCEVVSQHASDATGRFICAATCDD